MKKQCLVSIGLSLLFIMTFNCFQMVAFAQETDIADAYLMETGVSELEIAALDSDMKQFIADDLQRLESQEWKVKDIAASVNTHSENAEDQFSINVFVFQSGAEIRLYAVYESADKVFPVGYDALSLQLGNGYEPYEYGGQNWYKRVKDEEWTPGEELVANTQTLSGGIFSGRQLGSFNRQMLVKGCVYCYANKGAGSNDQITIDYYYNPSQTGSSFWAYFHLTMNVLIIIAAVVLGIRMRNIMRG